MSYFNFLENEVEKYGKYEFRPNIDQLKSIKIEKLNFEFLIKNMNINLMLCITYL